jgi:dihydroflavonol-4-reductase
VLEAAIRRSARRLVMTSTLGLFDRDQGVIREQTPLLKAASTRNPYLLAKLQADQLLEDGQARGLSVVRIHPAHMLGRYDRTGWISLFDQAQRLSLGAAPRGSASFCMASDVALAHLRAATLAHPSPRYILATADASYLDLFKAVARHVNKPTSARTVPSSLLKAVAVAAQWRAALTGKAPTVTPGLVEILTSDMIGRSELAMRELGIGPTHLDTMLQEAHDHWQTTERPST